MNKRSLWVFHLNSGSCNGCDIEVLALFSPRYDAERIGAKLVGSPRHADVIVFTGPVTVKAASPVLEALRAVPEPKPVLAVGSCACGGGIWSESYATWGGFERLYSTLGEQGINVSKVVLVPGCPPKPEALLHAILLAVGLAPQKQKKMEFVEHPGSSEEKLRKLLSEGGKKRLCSLHACKALLGT